MKRSAETGSRVSNRDHQTETEPAAPVVVVCAADELYAMPLAVMLESMSSHANPEQQMDVYIINSGDASHVTPLG